MIKQKVISHLIILIISILLFEGCAGLQPNAKYNRNRGQPPRRGIYDKSQQESTAKNATDDYLHDTIDMWIGTPYLYGGENRGWGVDCSSYVQQVMKRVYDLDLPRSSKEQFKQGKYIGISKLRRSDLVFFDTQGRGVSHVGIYLGDGMFTHASTSRGVCIENFKKYVKKYQFVGGRRVL